MKNRSIRSTLRLAPLAAALSFAAVIPLHAQTAVPKTPIYGVTLDTIAHLNKTITSLQKLPYRPTVRVVFDPGMTAADYYPALVKLHQVAYVMGEILDSSEFPTDLASYKARTQNFVSGLNGLVDIWEIANEINGEWLRPHPSGNAATVNAEEAAIGQMVAAAHSIVKSVGGKTAITLYYNDDSKGTNCWEKPQDYWKTWPTSFLSATVRQQTDYVFFSYYPYKDCPNLKPSWNADFAALETIFPNAKVGFGEIGTSSKSAPYSVQSNLITTYYPMVNSSTDPRFVGGFFWWNYAEQMVPYTTTYWNLLRNTIQPLKVPK